MTKTLLCYPGGKARLAKKIIALFPPHRIYAEPYAGGASVFFAKPPSPVEVLNDLDGAIVALYRVLQDPAKYAELQHRLNFTLYARAEFVRARRILLAPENYTDIDLAWAKFVAVSQGFAGMHESDGNWGRNLANRRLAKAFHNKVSRLIQYHRRLQNVQIDNIDALDFISYWDTEQTLFYLDPPYVHGARKDKRKVYAHEADDDHHEKLVDLLLTIKGKAILSGYENPIYHRLEAAGWHKVYCNTYCCMESMTRQRSDKTRSTRMEVLWLNFYPPR